MAKGTVNKIIVIGRLGVQPEVRYLTNNMAVMSVSLATNDGYKDRQTGQFVEVTEWHRVTVFGKQAETLGSYAKKGDLLYIEGRIKTTKYQDKNTGEDRYSTEIIANQTQMIGSKSQSDQPPLPDYIPPHIPTPSATQINDSSVHVTKQGKPIPTVPPQLNDIKDEDLDLPPF